MNIATQKRYIDLLKHATPEIKQKFGVESMRLFGSVARGDCRENSDVDLFVEMPPKAFRICALKDYLERLLGTAVDIIRKHSNLDPFILSEIERDGITIFS